MKQFARVLRLVFRRRLALACAILSALAVGVLWGGNIGTLYPVVEVAFRGTSLHGWIDLKIDECRQAIAEERAALQASENASADRQFHEAEIERQTALLTRYETLAPWIKSYTPDDPFWDLVLIVGLLLLGTAVKSAAVVANSVIVAWLAYRATFELRQRFFRRTLRLDVNLLDSDGTADLMSRFTHDMEQVRAGIMLLFGKLVREPMKMAVCLTGAAIISWRLLLVALLVVPPAAFAIRWLSRMLKRSNRHAMEEMAQLYGVLEETLRSIRVVQAFTTERRESRRFFETGRRYLRMGMKIARYNALSHPLTEMLGMTIISLAILGGAYMVMGPSASRASLSMPSLVLFFALLAGAADPIRKLSDVFVGLQRAAAAAERIYAMYDRKPRIRDDRRAVEIPRHHRDLTFENVTFSYHPGRPVLHDVSLRIPYGRTVVIVGPSGCGKSTLASLVPRFADPDSGSVLLDGIPLPKIRLKSLRRQIGLVTQEPTLFDDTVFNNIRYGSPNAGEAEVVAAAKKAHAHDFIVNELADGYATRVGPMGSNLSGGQRQRIALARAILRDPAILILDEATSQIDMESEQLIQDALEEFVQGRTTIIITHRLAAVSLADVIVVMHDGRILDMGSHAELLSRCGFYRRLHATGPEDLRASA
ncbi:ABC transporter ATP-binding protein [Thermostilla marina]